jgi:hypothetical protein
LFPVAALPAMLDELFSGFGIDAVQRRSNPFGPKVLPM